MHTLKTIGNSSFPINNGSGMTHMKLHFTNAEVGMWNAEGWSRCALSFFKIDRIHHFDIRFFNVSFSIRLAAFQASGSARMKLHGMTNDD
jgi:hypothetical protein